MAEVGSGSPLQLGLNGASSWASVAGQVLATQQGFGGNEDLSKALLARDDGPGASRRGARLVEVPARLPRAASVNDSCYRWIRSPDALNWLAR